MQNSEASYRNEQRSIMSRVQAPYLAGSSGLIWGHTTEIFFFVSFLFWGGVGGGVVTEKSIEEHGDNSSSLSIFDSTVTSHHVSTLWASRPC